MRIITGDECGLLKECLPDQGEANGVRRINGSQTMARKHGCIDLCWLRTEQDESFASLSMDRTCTVWERTTEDDNFAKYRKRSEVSNLFDTKTIHPSTKPLGLFAVDQDRVCACNAAGKVSIVNTSKEKIVKTFGTVKATDQDDSKKPLLTTCNVQAEQKRIAVGGQERDLTLWDLSTGNEVWKAKNARPDPQTLLQQQVWPSSIAFLEQNVIAVGSAHSEIRLYDVRQQRRPIALTPKGQWEHRITALCPLPNYALAIGDSAGYLQTMDWRNHKMEQITSRLVGPAGSIRAVVAHSEESRLAVVGLDRMLRIYDYKTRKQLHCMYLRQRLNCVLVGQETSVDQEQDEEADATGEDGLWDRDDKIEDYVDSDDEQEPKLEGEDEMIEDSDSSVDEQDASESERDEDDDDDDHDDGKKKNDDDDKSENDSDSGSEATEGSEESSSDDEADKEQAKPRKRTRR